ncbi:hypothetical protein CHS0354_000258 [Potamilus streckersoni]|uniref:PiggyBac transposable element-derived protein domain-containing protein n=1 Tax=Potamilus streckersoni TaxID=2493646 RepID=A0AAE0VY58_9BIVA|nr:hypothetical protein CHS0354_000258 [Potamilus streckersoni]
MQDVQDFWSTDPVMVTFFPSVMSRDRFLILISFFYLCNNAEYVARGVPGYNPVRKLCCVFINVISRFGSVFVPNRYLSLDEGMIPWRGKLSFRVYNPDTPIKYGIKSYMVCDSTNGYYSKFQLYVGKSNIPASENGKTYDLAMDMMHNFFGQGYTLFMDSYYLSLSLFLDLWELGTSAIGTVQSTRQGIPQTLKDKKLTV